MCTSRGDTLKRLEKFSQEDASNERVFAKSKKHYFIIFQMCQKKAMVRQIY